MARFGSMSVVEKLVRRSAPAVFRDVVRGARSLLAHPPLERIHLHGYLMTPDPTEAARLNLVIPSVMPAVAFGGVLTGLEIFFRLGKRLGIELRVILDDFRGGDDLSVLERCATDAGIDPAVLQIERRQAQVPTLDVRARDVFMTFSSWMTLNIRPIVDQQTKFFKQYPRPIIHLMQDYEPGFFGFSSTHAIVLSACSGLFRCWPIINSTELADYVSNVGFAYERTFVFEPVINPALRAHLEPPPAVKERRILVYGRPQVERNCYPAVVAGLQEWARTYRSAARWSVVSAGAQHPPLPLAAGQIMRSSGKLPLHEYAEVLRGTAVGLSLMASPHPSYPPLEMAHFGVLTITNRYVNKNLSNSHPNIRSLTDITPRAIADALAQACDDFDANPAAGPVAQTRRPSYLDPAPYGFIDDLCEALAAELSGRTGVESGVRSAQP